MKQFDHKKLDAIGKRFLTNHETIAVAESVSSGLLQFALSTIDNAAQLFQGGITVYNVAQKFKHLTVEPIHALQVNAVSQQVSDEMAIHVQELFASHWGVAVTGYASRVPESGKKLFAYFSIAQGNKIMCSGKLTGAGRNPVEVQYYYTQIIINNLHDVLMM